MHKKFLVKNGLVSFCTTGTRGTGHQRQQSLLLLLLFMSPRDKHSSQKSKPVLADLACWPEASCPKATLGGPPEMLPFLSTNQNFFPLGTRHCPNFPHAFFRGFSHLCLKLWVWAIRYGRPPCSSHPPPPWASAMKLF